MVVSSALCTLEVSCKLSTPASYVIICKPQRAKCNYKLSIRRFLYYYRRTSFDCDGQMRKSDSNGNRSLLSVLDRQRYELRGFVVGKPCLRTRVPPRLSDIRLPPSAHGSIAAVSATSSARHSSGLSDCYIVDNMQFILLDAHQGWARASRWRFVDRQVGQIKSAGTYTDLPTNVRGLCAPWTWQLVSIAIGLRTVQIA